MRRPNFSITSHTCCTHTYTTVLPGLFCCRPGVGEPVVLVVAATAQGPHLLLRPGVQDQAVDYKVGGGACVFPPS